MNPNSVRAALVAPPERFDIAGDQSDEEVRASPDWALLISRAATVAGLAVVLSSAGAASTVVYVYTSAAEAEAERQREAESVEHLRAVVGLEDWPQRGRSLSDAIQVLESTPATSLSAADVASIRRMVDEWEHGAPPDHLPTKHCLSERPPPLRGFGHEREAIIRRRLEALETLHCLQALPHSPPREEHP